MTRIPPPWMIEELRHRRESEQSQRPCLEAPPPMPPRATPIPDAEPKRVIVIDIFSAEEGSAP
ncbi:MAG TPA: hypothetical protein VMT17_01870 [Anaeromyxobacteraceae bacterium]|nr:hypothetical protein [Anaeromyxobacteraceae bacterium]